MTRTRLGKMERKKHKEEWIRIATAQKEKKKKETISNKIAAAKGLREKKRISIGNTENIEEIAMRKRTQPKIIVPPAAAETYGVQSRPIQRNRLPLVEIDINMKENLQNPPKKTEIIPPKPMEPPIKKYCTAFDRSDK